MHYARALEIARSIGADPEQFLHLYTRLGRGLELSNRYEPATEKSLSRP